MRVSPRSKRRSAGAVGEPVGARLRRLREERGITQGDLARTLGISQSDLSRYESGQFHLRAAQIVQIARVLRVSTDQLLGVTRTKEDGLVGTPRFRRLLRQAETLSRRDRQALLRMIQGFLNGQARSA